MLLGLYCPGVEAYKEQPHPSQSEHLRALGMLDHQL